MTPALLHMLIVLSFISINVLVIGGFVLPLCGMGAHPKSDSKGAFISNVRVAETVLAKYATVFLTSIIFPMLKKAQAR